MPHSGKSCRRIHLFGKEKAEHRAGPVTFAAAELDEPALRFNQAARHPQANAGADVRLGGEKGNEEALLYVVGHAASIVAHADAHAALHFASPMPRRLGA